MATRIFFFSILTVIFISCGGRSDGKGAANIEHPVVKSEKPGSSLSEAETAFMANLSGLCGKSFRGKETYSAPGRDSWSEKSFLMHVTICEDDRIHIPFHINGDKSRTWMFLVEEKGLRFRHDHRHEDGTPEDLTMYGGYSDGTGTAYIQKFPADEYTVDLLQDVLGREWIIILDEDMSSMKYQLHYSGKLMFEGEFDLRAPVL